MKPPPSSSALARTILRLLGWTVDYGMPDVPKYVIIGAPHTSNWDFVFMLLLRSALGINPRWIGKHTLFRPPFGPLMRWLGGIPVDRSKPHDLVSQIAGTIAATERISLIVTPEGTRGNAPRWKSGFYHIARQAGVPIALGYIDFARKRGGIARAVQPTGDLEADFQIIKRFYSKITGKRPDKQGPISLQGNSQ